jgi:phage regulator Rha-like protein
LSNIVFLSPDKIDSVPFTTSDIVAEHAQIKYRQVQDLCQKYESDLREFGILTFETSVSGKAGQPKHIYRLNEEQATLLITYLKNTKPVREFKKELVRQFFLMRKELNQRGIYRAELKPIRLELTDAIKELIPESPHKKWAYKQYTDLAYKIVTGRTAAQLRKERCASAKVVAIDFMNAEEIQQVAKAQSQIAVLLELGMDYEQAKTLISNRLKVGKKA